MQFVYKYFDRSRSIGRKSTKLTQEVKVLIVLFYKNGEKVSDIARATQRPVSTVFSVLEKFKANSFNRKSQQIMQTVSGK